MRVKLIKMQDPYPLPEGSIGTITGTDALGDYLVEWDSGSSLKFIPGVDDFVIIEEDQNS